MPVASVDRMPAALPGIPRVLLLALSVSAFSAVGCAPESEGDEVDGASAMTTAQATPDLTAKYGIRPRRYEGYLNSSNEAEYAFSETLREATVFLRQRIAEREVDVTVDEDELATNALAEGLGATVLEPNVVDGLSGFNSLGLDTLVDALPAYKPWLHPEVLAHVRPENIETQTNEKKQTVRSLGNLSVRLGVLACAGVYTWFKARAAADFAAKGLRLSLLPPSGQMYWATVYYNAGAGAGKDWLDKYGVDKYREKWTRGDDFIRYSTNPHFNALLRAASFELLQQTVYEHGKRPPTPALPMVAAGTEKVYPLKLRAEDDVQVAEVTVKDFGKLAEVRLEVTLAAPNESLAVPVGLSTYGATANGTLRGTRDGRAVAVFEVPTLGAARSWQFNVQLPPSARAETLALRYVFR